MGGAALVSDPVASVNSVLSGYGTTIFTVMSALAQAHGAINLGQGFPDGEGPDDIREFAARSLLDGPNQYPPAQGIPALRQAVAAHNTRFYDLSIDWEHQVLVTSGATEALAASLFGLLNPGDEVVLFAPLYDSYLPIVQLAGAVPRIVPLSPPDWALPGEALAAACSARTKVILVNSPMNPTGKVFARDELSMLAELARRYDAYLLCDEVYEHLTFDGVGHVPAMTLPGMRERAIRIGSAGKTFSLTGWKVGYITAATHLCAAIFKAHQFLTFTTPPNLQAAVAYGLAKPDSYFTTLSRDLQYCRDLLSDGLEKLGFRVLPSAGTYFLAADFGALAPGISDVEFCRKLTIEAGVAAVPFSAFYGPASTGSAANPLVSPPEAQLVRFCFCKPPELLEKALARLTSHFGGG